MKKCTIFIWMMTVASSTFANSDEQNGCSNGTLEIGADYLYWKAFQDSMEYAADVLALGGDITSNVLSPDFRGNSGFRIYADYIFNNEEWKVGGIYTHLFSTASNNLELNPADFNTHFIVLNSASFPIFTAVNANNINFSSLDARWSSDMDYFDLDFGREICVCNWLAINPHMGLRGLWMRQTLNLEGSNPAAYQFESKFDERLDSLGLEGGLNATFKLGRGLAIVGHLGGSLLYARIKTSEQLSIQQLGADLLEINTSHTIYHLCPTIDGFLGAEYDGCFGRYAYNVHMGWEQHVFMNVNHFNIYNYADLTLQGLTVGGSIGF